MTDDTIRSEAIGFIEIGGNPLTETYIGAVAEDRNKVRGPSADEPGRYVLVREDTDG